MGRFIETRHTLRTGSRVVDVRPWDVKFAEVMGQKFALIMSSVPLLLFAFFVPILAMPLLGVLSWLIVLHRSSKPTLPLRYPIINKEPDPKTGKAGDGIMMHGNIDSSSPYEKFKEIWSADDDLRKHMLIIGSTGSGKSEMLKAIFFNALCWSSGYFIADGKADNKLPTDSFTMVRSVGRDDDLLSLNFLLGGKTPLQIGKSRRRRTNGMNPFSSADADTIIQMGANMLPKVEGEGKNWQEKALNLWRGTVAALCHKRDTQGFEVSVTTIIDYLALHRVEDLYIEGYREALANNGEWSLGFTGIKSYLETGIPYKLDRLLAKHGLGEMPAAPRAGAKPTTDQDPESANQHAYRTSQLIPVMNLLDKTYGHIFRPKFSEIDMLDVTLNNRIMTMLIPSLEKSAQEAENLGKLAIACLRVMMGRNLGADIEGSRQELIESKVTKSPYPYIVALDELAYYFSDGIAVIFAQARSLGFSMIAAAQDLEKLTEGNRAAEAGAMMGNQVNKVFMRIDDAKKTWEFIQSALQKVTVAVRSSYQATETGWRHKPGEVDLREVDAVSLPEFQAMKGGECVLNSMGQTLRMKALYMAKDLDRHQTDNFFVLRFLQVPSPKEEEVNRYSIGRDQLKDKFLKGEILKQRICGAAPVERPEQLPADAVIEAAQRCAASLSPHVGGSLRAIALYQAARDALLADERRMSSETEVAAQQPNQAQASPEVEASYLGSSSAQAGDAARGDATRRESAAALSTSPASIQGADIMGLADEQSALLADLLPFERKPVSAVAKPAATGWAVVAPTAAQVDPIEQARQSDPVEAFLAGLKVFNMPALPLSVSGLEHADSSTGVLDAVAMALLGPTSNAPVQSAASETQPGTSWVSRAFDVVNQEVTAPVAPSAGEPSSEATVVGFTQETSAGVEKLHSALGNDDPKAATREIEAQISRQITPAISATTEIDAATLAALLDDLDTAANHGG
jgi:intracellular multiplication protein IcmO